MGSRAGEKLEGNRRREYQSGRDPKKGARIDAQVKKELLWKEKRSWRDHFA